jgi:SAM-dependent methyltransferase
MGTYEGFAGVYAKGMYPRYSSRIAAILPGLLKQFNAFPRTLLDLACGEGTFCVAMAKRGIKVEGIDQSREMLKLARQKARRNHVNIRFRRMDMRNLPFVDEFDLVTCWYDSLNYLLRTSSLNETFSGVYRALREGGLFIFDMNTIHALSVSWQRQPYWLRQDTADIVDIQRTRYKANSQIAELRITAFLRRGKTWTRFDEIHRERAYQLSRLRQELARAGLRELACWGSIRKLTPPKRNAGRVWVVASRPAHLQLPSRSTPQANN